MFTFRFTAELKDDHRIVLTLPPEVPTGPTELTVSVASSAKRVKRPRTSLATWAEEHAENWAEKLNSEDVDGFTGRRF